MRSAITLLIGTLLGNAFALANPPAGIISHAIDTSTHNPPPTTQLHHFAARDGAINPESKPDSAGTGTGTGIIPATDALKAGGDVHRIGNRAVSSGKCPTCVCQCPPAVNAAAGGRLRSGAGRGLGVVLGVFGVGVGFLGL